MNWNMQLFVFEVSKKLLFKFKQDCCKSLAISDAYISSFEQVFACKETSYVEVTNLCK